MRVILRTKRDMGEESSTTIMVIFTKVTGQVIKERVKANSI